ncbi:protein ACCELERATED CELL DEATH 6-like [Actinidia eriantha]|uniref:protein ACCELERATED CELL DEATH 6-like n=1 Tax=Actinidia eriantha TaxID=165200 RepID=UPI00258EE11F|nr:protein ACCELERATED CELL DEATH 6-like [Actinidia eriantha]
MSILEGPGLLGEEEEGYGVAESMDPDLYRATTEGDILEFIRAMERAGPLDRPYGPPAACVQLGPQKNTVLHIATSYGHYEIVKLLCKDLPFFVAEKNSKGNTPLHIAARAGDWLLVILLVNSDYRDSDFLAEENEEGNTALHEALAYRHEKVARILIDKNRNMLYSVNKEGKSVLYLAAEAGYACLVKLLMENPAGNCSAKGRLRHKSPVHAAILGRNIEVLKILWEKDQSSFHLRCDEEGRNALHCAASIGYLEGVDFLLSKICAAAYQRDKNGLFPIHVASSKGHVDVIQEMLHQCPDSRELLTLQGQNIFHVATKSGKAEAVSCILKMPELSQTGVEISSGVSFRHLPAELISQKVMDPQDQAHQHELNGNLFILLFVANEIRRITAQQTRSVTLLAYGHLGVEGLTLWSSALDLQLR